MSSIQQRAQLLRELGPFGAVLMGLGSILGTGVFVSVGLVVIQAGGWVLPATLAAAFLALCNALSSAQLAANHPTSGGTYAYGTRYLGPWPGFMAGWLFLLAKSFSAATAALGFAGYLAVVFEIEHPAFQTAVAATVVVLVTALVVSGLKRSNFGNTLIVGFSVLVLACFAGYGFFFAPESAVSSWSIEGEAASLPVFLQATALMFVAYTGYGRIATLGEEVADPRRNIPRAILWTLAFSALLYGAIAWNLATVPREWLAANPAAPLESVAMRWESPLLAGLIALGAATAMIGVLLNLVLGLSRVLFAMGREGDMPRVFGQVTASRSPRAAILGMGAIVLAMVFIGNVGTTWSFSAFTVLGYYAVTNASALKLTSSERLYPRLFSWLGLVGCLGLAFWVEIRIWVMGLGLIGLGALWRLAMRR